MLIDTTSAAAMGPGANNFERQTSKQWRYCTRTTGRFRVLTADVSYAGGQGDLVSVQEVLLAGTYAAYATTTITEGGRDYGTTYGDVVARDLLTGLQRDIDLGYNGARPLLLSPPGAVLWQRVPFPQAGQPNGCGTWEIDALDARTGWIATLDSTTPGCDPANPSVHPTDPFGSLQLQGCIAGCSPVGATYAWWTDSAGWRSARIR